MTIPDAFLGKVPPHSAEAELSVIGGVLLHNQCLDDIGDIVRPQDFYEERHETIFQTVLELASKRMPVDLLTLANALAEKGELEPVGGREYLASILDQVPTSANIEAHARLVQEKAAVRSCIHAALEILQKGYGDYGDAKRFKEEAEEAILSATEDHRERDVAALKDVVIETVGWLGQLAKSGVTTFGLPTGLMKVDAMLGGLQPGGYYIIAGATSHGKSALAMQIAAAAGVPVYFASLEMSRRQLALRMLARESEISVHRLLKPRYWGGDEGNEIMDAADRLYDLPIYIDDRGGNTPAKIAAKTRRLIRKHNIGLGIVDYVQIGQPSRTLKGQSREREVASMSAEYKALAKNADIPIIALSQLNRKGSKKDERPALDHLRDSGSLEQDADAVLLVWRPEKGKQNPNEREKAQIIVAKNRITGPIGTANVDFIPARTLFCNPEGQQDNDMPF